MPDACPICLDERQYVGLGGQRWTTLEELRSERRCDIREDSGYLGIGVAPELAIGQRLLLAESPEGNVVWDMIPLVDDAAVEAVRARGDVRAIAISHPHYYSGMVEWSEALGDVPVLLHEADREWIMRPDPRIELWSGDVKDLGGGLTLLRLGGHYPGGTVLHDGNRSTLLSGDIVMVIPDRQHRQLHVELPQPDPAAGRGGPADRCRAGAVALRADPRRLVGAPRAGRRQRGRAALGGALRRAP